MLLGTWCSAPLQIYICIKKKGLITFHCVTPKQVTEHVIMLKEIFDRQDSIFWKHTSIFLWNMYLCESIYTDLHSTKNYCE